MAKLNTEMRSPTTEDRQLILDLTKVAADALYAIFKKYGDRYGYTLMLVDRQTADCNFMGNGDRDIMLEVMKRATEKAQQEVDNAPPQGKPN